MKLNPKQERFCHEYIIDLNATQAAVRAKYSEKTAYSQGQRLLKNVEAQKLITELNKIVFDDTQITARDVRSELIKCGFSNVQDFISDNNSIQDISRLEKQKAAAVSGIEQSVTTDKLGNETVNTKFKLYDKIKSLELLGRHLSMFTDNSNQNLTFTKPVIIDWSDDSRSSEGNPSNAKAARSKKASGSK